jgi:16S rRNA processing protein RimM
MSKLENPVQMAVIGAAHGIKGELRVKTFTGDPLALA